MKIALLVSIIFFTSLSLTCMEEPTLPQGSNYPKKVTLISSDGWKFQLPFCDISESDVLKTYFTEEWNILDAYYQAKLHECEGPELKLLVELFSKARNLAFPQQKKILEVSKYFAKKFPKNPYLSFDHLCQTAERYNFNTVRDALYCEGIINHRLSNNLIIMEDFTYLRSIAETNSFVCKNDFKRFLKFKNIFPLFGMIVLRGSSNSTVFIPEHICKSRFSPFALSEINAGEALPYNDRVLGAAAFLLCEEAKLAPATKRGEMAAKLAEKITTNERPLVAQIGYFANWCGAILLYYATLIKHQDLLKEQT